MEFLTEDLLFQLTRKKRPSAQHKVLNTMGIDHKVNPSGKVLVLRSHLEKVMGGMPEFAKKKQTEPNWNAIRA